MIIFHGEPTTPHNPHLKIWHYKSANFSGVKMRGQPQP